MPQSVTKSCKTCGKDFESPLVRGQVSSTVNCPSCRGGKRVQVTKEPAYRESYHTCKDCGQRFSRGDALKHRRETGHKF